MRWKRMNKRRKIAIISVITAFVILAIVSTIYAVSKIPPDFEKLSDEKVLEYVKSGKAKKLDEELLIKLGERLEEIPPEQIRQIMGGLTPKERESFRETRRRVVEARIQKTIHEFFSLPADKQNEFLDRQIDEMEKRRQDFRQRFGERMGRLPEGFGGPEGGRPPQGVEIREGVSSTGPQVPQQGEVIGLGRRNISPDARLQRMRNRLSEITPEERAKRREYFRRLRERMRERGLIR